MIMTLEFIKLYSMFALINLAFIIVVLRAVYFLINKSDPINVVKINPMKWRWLQWTRKDRKKEMQMRLS